MQKSDKVLFGFVAASTVFDYGMTVWGVGQCGISCESNPIARSAIQMGPVALAIFVLNQMAFQWMVLQIKNTRLFGWGWNIAATYGHVFGGLSWLPIVWVTQFPRGI